MASIKVVLFALIFGLVNVIPSANAFLFGCSADKRRCLNSCNERHRNSTFSFVTRSACQARCILSECIVYPNRERKRLHPAERLKGYSS